MGGVAHGLASTAEGEYYYQVVSTGPGASGGVYTLSSWWPDEGMSSFAELALAEATEVPEPQSPGLVLAGLAAARPRRLRFAAPLAGRHRRSRRRRLQLPCLLLLPRRDYHDGTTSLARAAGGTCVSSRAGVAGGASCACATRCAGVARGLH